MLLVLQAFDLPGPVQTLGHAQVVDVEPTLKHEFVLFHQTVCPRVSPGFINHIRIVHIVLVVLAPEFSLKVHIKAPLTGGLNHLGLEFFEAVDLEGLEAEEHRRLERWLHQRLALVRDNPRVDLEDVIVHFVIALQVVLFLVLAPFVRHVKGTGVFRVVHSRALKVWTVNTVESQEFVAIIRLFVGRNQLNLEVLGSHNFSNMLY